MASELYQFYIAPGSTSVSITAAIFNVGGVTLDTETTTNSVSGTWPSSVWRIQDGQTFEDRFGATYDFDDYASVTRDMFNVPAYQPTIVAKPKTAAEVVDVLNYCDTNGLSFKVRSGTHSYAGEGIGTGVIIDMKLINGATFDAVNKWIDVDGGCLQWQPNAALEFQVATTGGTSAYGETNETRYNNVRVGATDNPPGYWTPSAGAANVGWSSIATSGGISVYPNRVGLMCDLILEADIIVGKVGGGYELVTATPTNEHAELLDGIRGIGNSTLGIITRLRHKVFERKQAFKTRVGLSWRPSGESNADFRPSDANLWGITAGSTAGGWTAAHTSDQWKFGKDLYETYQETLMGGETYGAGHPLAGKRIWPHGITNGIDGTYFMWGNYKYPDSGWDDYSITYHFTLDSFQGDQGLTGGIPEHQWYLAQTIIDRTIAKDSTRYERFRTGTQNGNPVDTIRLRTTTATADQGIWAGQNPSESGLAAQENQTTGMDTMYSLNGALSIPTTASGATAHANVAESNFDFYRDIITDINPGITNVDGGDGRQGIYYRWYTHSTSPDGPIVNPPHGISHNLEKDTLGWRDRPSEIQMFDRVESSGATDDDTKYSDLFYTSGANLGKLTPLGKDFQNRRVQWYNEMIQEYGGNDPRSYIGYLDPVAKKYQTPNGSPLDINRFYYGPTGVNNINALKATYDPNSKFPTGPVIKPIALDDFTTITQNITGYDGTQTTFSWTLNSDAIESTGTFADGSHWVVKAAGEDLKLYHATPKNTKDTVNITAFGETTSLDVYRNGVSINEKVGYEHNSLDDLISLTNTQVTGGWRTTDNRHSKIFNASTPIQSQLDEWFDVSTFESRKTILDGGTAGPGITLSTDDSIVLTRSYWDASDNSRPAGSSSWSDGIMLTGEDTRTAVAQTAVLSVLSAAPSEPCFRPPIQWSDSDRANRPMYPVSQFDHTNWGITQGHAAHISEENSNNIDVPLDRILSSPFLHTQGGYLYASSFPREAFANEDSGYGNRIVKGFNAAICELYNSNITDETDESKLNLLYRIVQYGIDNLGTINRRAYTAAGAGQKPALSAPWMQLSLSALGVTHGIDSVMRTFMPGASNLVSGSTSMAAVKQRCFHEDYTLRQVVVENPDYWTTVPYTGCGLQLGNSAGYGATLDLSNINGGVLVDYDGNNVLEPKDGYSDGIQLTYPLSKGMGRIDFTQTPMEMMDTISYNGTDVKTVSTPPKGSYAMNYIGCRLGIKQDIGEIEKMYTLTMLSENAGAYNKANNSNSSGSCSFWVDRPLDSQPDSSSEIRLYPFTTDDDGAWIYCKEGATRPDGEDPYGAGFAGRTLGIIPDTSIDLRSAAYESTSAISWIPIYTLIRNNYSKMGLPVSNIGEAINGYMATILEQTTNNDRRWMLMYGAENGWFDNIIPATDPLYWLSHSGITSASKYFLPGTEPVRAFGGRPYYEVYFAGRTGDAIDRMQSGPNGVYVESKGCSSRNDINRYGSSTLRYGTVGSNNPTMQHWFSPEVGTPFTITDNANGQGIYPNNGEIAALDNVVSTFENLPGGTVDAIYTISGVTYAATATISEASTRVGKFDVTFVSGGSADEFRTEAIGVSGSGATIGIQYTPQINFAASSDPQEWRVIPYRSEETYDRETAGGAALTSPGGEGEQYFNWMFRSKHNNDRVYGAHDCAVPWVTEDNGNTWRKLKSEFLYGRQVQSMLESPDDENVLFITMSDYDPDIKDYSRRLKGIYRSEDRGKTFKLLRRQSVIQINDVLGRNRTNEDVLVYDPTLVNGKRVYYWGTDGDGSSTKVWYRSIGGIEWEPVSDAGGMNQYGYTGPDGRYRQMIYHFQTAVHRTNHKVFIACDAGLFYSDNAHTAPAGGVTFAPVDSAGTTLPHWFTSVVFDPIDDDVMYASSQSPGVFPEGVGSFAGFGDGNIWKSTDAGETWNVHMSRELLGYIPTSVDPEGDMTFTPYSIFLSSVTGDTAWVLGGPLLDGKYRSFFFDDFSNPDYTRPVSDRYIYNLDMPESNSVWQRSLVGARSQVAPYPDINRKNEGLIMSMAIICGTTNGKDFRYSQDWFKGENWSSMAFDSEDDRKMYAASEDTGISTAVCDSKTGEILYWNGVPGKSNVYTGWFTTKKIVIDGDRLYTGRGYSIGKRKLLRHPNRFEMKYNAFEIPPNGVDYRNLDTSTSGAGINFIGPNNTKIEDFTVSPDNRFVPHNFEEFFKHPITGRIASGDNISTDPTGIEFVPIPSLRTDHQLAGARAISSEVFGMSIDQSNDDVYLWAVNGATGNVRNQILRGLWGGTAGISWDYIEKNLDPQTNNVNWPRDKYNFGDTSYALECHSKDPNIMWARVSPSGANNRFDGHLYRYDHSASSGSRWTLLNYVKDSAEEYSEAGITGSIQDDNGQNYPTPQRQMNVIGGIIYDPNGGSLYPDGVLYVTPYYASGHIIYRSTDLGTSFDHMDYDLPCLSNTKIDINPITGELVRGGCDGSYVHPPPVGYERRDDYATMWGRGWTLINPTYPT